MAAGTTSIILAMTLISFLLLAIGGFLLSRSPRLRDRPVRSLLGTLILSVPIVIAARYTHDAFLFVLPLFVGVTAGLVFHLLRRACEELLRMHRALTGT